MIIPVPVDTMLTLRYVPKAGVTFKGWTVVKGGITLADPMALTITFAMPTKDVEITANVE